MKRVEITSEYHDWDKVNLVSNKDGSDTWQCKKCKMKGNRPAFAGFVMVPNTTSDYKIAYCIEKKKVFTFKEELYTVRFLGTMDPRWANMKPKTVHKTVPPPKGESEDKGKWFMGATKEPVFMFFNEITVRPQMKRRKPIN